MSGLPQALASAFHRIRALPLELACFRGLQSGVVSASGLVSHSSPERLRCYRSAHRAAPAASVMSVAARHFNRMLCPLAAIGRLTVVVM